MLAFPETLGATEVDSIDASDYESATIIHDMNLPVTDAHKKTFDVALMAVLSNISSTFRLP